MDEIQVPLPTQSRCPESPRLQHSWSDVQNHQNHIAHQALLQRAGNVKVAVELIMIVKKDTDLYDMEWAIRQ